MGQCPKSARGWVPAALCFQNSPLALSYLEAAMFFCYNLEPLMLWRWNFPQFTNNHYVTSSFVSASYGGLQSLREVLMGLQTGPLS